MRSTELIRQQLSGVHELFREVANDLTDVEWMLHALPETNVIGFTLWHLPRVQDWAVQTAVRGVSEVICDPRWKHLGDPDVVGIGVGMSLEEADAVARSVTRADVCAYADAVYDETRAWLDSLDDDDLDAIPNFAAHHRAHPIFQRPDVQAEIADLMGAPVWRYLTGPCVGHWRGHFGEIAVLKQVMRSAHGSVE